MLLLLSDLERWRLTTLYKIVPRKVWLFTIGVAIYQKGVAIYYCCQSQKPIDNYYKMYFTVQVNIRIGIKKYWISTFIVFFLRTRKHNQHLYPTEQTYTSKPTSWLHKPLHMFGKYIFSMLQHTWYLHRQFFIYLFYNFQAVFDSLFLIFSNSIFAVSALIWPHQVQPDYEVFTRIMRA